MKLDNLVVDTTTTMLVKAKDGGPLMENGVEQKVLITGHTPDSSEWRRVHKEVYGSPKPLAMQVGKGKTAANTVQLPVDPDAFNKRIRLLAGVVTNIEGLTDWQFSKEAVKDLFSNDGLAYVVNQWEDHLEEGANFLDEPETTVNSGSDVSPGSTEAMIALG